MWFHTRPFLCSIFILKFYSMKPILTLLSLFVFSIITYAQHSVFGTWRPVSMIELNGNEIRPINKNIIKAELAHQYGDITFSKDSTFHIFSESSKNFSTLTDWFIGKSLNGNWKFGKSSILQFQYSKINDPNNTFILFYQITKLTTSELEIVYHIPDTRKRTTILFKRIE